MILSMTGFGRGEACDPKREYNVEIKSVNHRFLEIKLRLPREIQQLETDLRSKISNAVSRGSVDVTVTRVSRPGVEELDLNLNLQIAKKYYQALEKISKALHLKSTITAESVARFPEVLNISVSKIDDKRESRLIEKALKIALENLIKMRKNEGSRLKKIMMDEVVFLEKCRASLLQIRDKIIDQYRERLTERIKKWNLEGGLDPNRIAQEVAIYADRSDITEEIDRLGSHLEQFNQTLRSGGSVGRKCDFLIQELLRETNTIGSKLPDGTTTKLVDMKSSIEKLREQVQNIE